jgi:hypothetical protein
VTYTDKVKAWTELDPLKSKDLMFQSYKEYEAWLYNQFGVRIKEFHYDGTSTLFSTHLKQKGPQQSTRPQNRMGSVNISTTLSSNMHAP